MKALERIQNSLPYKLGLAMIDFDKGNFQGIYRFFKLFSLFCTLYKIKKAHLKQNELYQQTILVFPSLKREPLKTLKDYKKEQFAQTHLAYLFGAALIKAHKQRFSGGYLRLNAYIKEAKNEYKKFKELSLLLEDLNLLDYFTFSTQALFSKKGFEFLNHHLKDIKIWLNSKEFKEKYLDTKHSLPPLLNPDTIDYKAIEPELAWELNLPLPKGYKAIFVMPSFCGHTAMVRMLQRCGVSIADDHFWYIKHHYCFNYKALLENKFVFINVSLYDFEKTVEEAKKFFLRLNQKVPIVWTMRDPVSKLRAAVNHCGFQEDLRYDFKEGDDLSALCEPRLLYIAQNLEKRIRLRLTDFKLFACGEFYDFVYSLGFRDFNFFDISSIEPKNAFETLCMLSEIYGFKAPLCKDDFAFNTYIQYFIGFLPLRYECCGCDFLISPYENAVLTHSEYFIGYEFNKMDKLKTLEVSELLSLNTSAFEKRIYIYTQKENLDKITLNKTHIKEKLQAFIDKFKEGLDLEYKVHKTNEKALIEFFKDHKDLRDIFHHILQKESSFIQEIRPDIVALWKYCLEFEKMYKELEAKQ